MAHAASCLALAAVTEASAAAGMARLVTLDKFAEWLAAVGTDLGSLRRVLWFAARLVNPMPGSAAAFLPACLAAADAGKPEVVWRLVAVFGPLTAEAENRLACRAAIRNQRAFATRLRFDLVAALYYACETGCSAAASSLAVWLATRGGRVPPLFAKRAMVRAYARGFVETAECVRAHALLDQCDQIEICVAAAAGATLAEFSKIYFALSEDSRARVLVAIDNRPSCKKASVYLRAEGEFARRLLGFDQAVKFADPADDAVGIAAAE